MENDISEVKIWVHNDFYVENFMTGNSHSNKTRFVQTR